MLYCASRFSLVHLIIHLHYLLWTLPVVELANGIESPSVRERGQLTNLGVPTTKFLAQLDRLYYLAMTSLEIRSIFPGTEELISLVTLSTTLAKRKTYFKWPMTCSASLDVIIQTTRKS